MNQKFIALGTGLLFAGAAAAFTPTTRSFPEMLPALAGQESAQTSSSMQRAPLNPNKDMGTKIFAHTVNGWDYDLSVHYLDFFTGNPKQLNKLESCILTFGNRWDRDNPRMLGPVAGTWAGDGYYAHRLVYYSLGITRINNWVKVDPETGYSEQLQLITETGADPQWWQLPQALLWNPNDPGTLYAMHRNDDGSVTSVISIVDKATGEYKTRVATLPEYYMAAAYDYDNQLLALRWEGDAEGNIVGTRMDVLDPTDDYNVISSTPILVNGQPYGLYYDTNSIAVDYTTGDIWWSAWGLLYGEESFSANYLIKIDPLTYATENYGKMGVDEGLDGLFVPYQELGEARTAPARVENLNFTKDDNGNNKVTLSWTNPTTYWNRRSMKNLTEVQIYRDNLEGQPVGTVAATGMEGQAMTWVDENGVQGVHKYYVVPVNAKGKGVPRSIDAFVGRDVPGEVQNLLAVTNDTKTIELSWDAPVRGDNDGWFDASDLTYTITRMPDRVNLGTTKETTFHDTTIGEAQLYSYSVVASNAEGSGTATVSNGVLAGNGIRPPFSTDFKTAIDAQRFTSIDKNYDGRRFEYHDNSHILRQTMYLDISNGSNDDILVSPTLILEKGKTYKVQYREYFGYIDGKWDRVSTQPVRIVGGTAPTAEAMTDIFVEDLERTVNHAYYDGDTYTAYFKSPVDGDYYIGYELLTANEGAMWLYIESFSIEEAPADDLAATALQAHRYLSTIEDNIFTVEVYNNGENKQSDYKVQIAYLSADGEPNVFAETDMVPELEPYQTDYVELEGIVPVLGSLRIVALTNLANDGNPANDMSPVLNAECEEVPALNNTVTDLTTKAVDTNLPLSHYYPCTATQTIYTPDMTIFDRIYAGKNPAITRVAWEYESIADFIPFESTRLSVYMSQTDKTGYGRYDIFLPVTDAPLFDEYVPFYLGSNYMVVDFDEPYFFDPAKPLVLTVAKEETEHGGEYIVRWNCFGFDWGAAEYQSMRYQSSSPMDVANPGTSGQSYAGAPIVHLTVKTDLAGVDEVVLTGNGAVYFSAATSTVESVDFDMTSVEVYDLSGKLVKTVAVAEGATSAYIGCEKGLYLLKVNGTDRVITLKVRI